MCHRCTSEWSGESDWLVVERRWGLEYPDAFNGVGLINLCGPCARQFQSWLFREPTVFRTER